MTSREATAEKLLKMLAVSRESDETKRQEWKKFLKREVRGPKEEKRKEKVEEKEKSLWDV